MSEDAHEILYWSKINVVQVWVHPSATLNDVMDKAIPAVRNPFPILPGMKRVKITLIVEDDPV